MIIATNKVGHEQAAVVKKRLGKRSKQKRSDTQKVILTAHCPAAFIQAFGGYGHNLWLHATYVCCLVRSVSSRGCPHAQWRQHQEKDPEAWCWD
jgi:hypothetical protein